MYRTVLVPTDGSARSMAALDHALELASAYDATVHGLYVVDATYYADMDLGEVRRALTGEGERATARLAERAAEADVPVVTEVRRGSPGETILAYADEVDADLVVMGTQGRTGVGRLLLGSVTERVVRAADVPVLTVRAGEAPVSNGDAQE